MVRDKSILETPKNTNQINHRCRRDSPESSVSYQTSPAPAFSLIPLTQGKDEKMDLTPTKKAYIDGLDYRSLLSRWRFAPAGNKWFQGETGAYWGSRMNELRNTNPAEAVAASKSLGFNRPRLRRL